VLLNSCGPVQIWLSANRAPNISMLLQMGINDQPVHWSHGRRGNITPKQRNSFFISLSFISPSFSLSPEEPRFHEPSF